MKNTLEMMFNSPFTIHEKSPNLYIDLEQILKYGTFHGVRRYSHVNALASTLPKPDYIDYEGYHSDYDCELIYGDIGVYITDSMVEQIEIFVDTEDGYIDGGSDCEVNYWEFEDYEEINLFMVEGVLTTECIDFSIVFDPYNANEISLTIPQSGVTLQFRANEYSDDTYDYPLFCITV